MRNNAIVHFLLRRAGSRFVERNGSTASSRDARQMVKAAKSGQSLAIFPEGTFQQEPGLLRFQRGRIRRGGARRNADRADRDFGHAPHAAGGPRPAAIQPGTHRSICQRSIRTIRVSRTTVISPIWCGSVYSPFSTSPTSSLMQKRPPEQMHEQ